MNSQSPNNYKIQDRYELTKFGQEFKRLIDNYAYWIQKHGINLHLEQDVTIDTVKDFNPDVLLLPIDLFNDFMKYFKTKIEWSIDKFPQLYEEQCNLKIFWSNKYAPLKSIMLFNSNEGTWHVMKEENTDNNISFAIGESEQSDKVVYFIETLVYYSIENKDAFLKINLSH